MGELNVATMSKAKPTAFYRKFCRNCVFEFSGKSLDGGGRKFCHNCRTSDSEMGQKIPCRTVGWGKKIMSN